MRTRRAPARLDEEEGQVALAGVVDSEGDLAVAAEEAAPAAAADRDCAEDFELADLYGDFAEEVDAYVAFL
eukprot:tig00000254_g22473.t1